MEIVVEAFNAFNLEIPEEWRWKIAIMSDGFPFYVHLICEQILWHVFEIPEAVSKIADRHYKLGLQQAIACISAELKRPYNVATQSDPKLFEPILWGTASSERLDNDIGDMYHGYEHVIDQLDDVALLDRGKFGDRLRRLVKKSHGEILISEKRRGWYKYRESMLRGYVRMQADANGIDLIERLARTAEKKHLKVSSHTTGYRGPMTPPGVRFAREETKRQR